MKAVFRNSMIAVVLVVTVFLLGCGGGQQPAATGEGGTQLKSEYRFVMMPMVAQAWFDIVRTAADRTAAQLSEQLGVRITIDYQAPPEADLVSQNDMLERAMATRPDGIAIMPIDAASQLSILREAEAMGIPVVLFASEPPAGELIPHIGNDFYEQGEFAARALLERINYRGKVAIVHGVPTSAPHAQRYQAYVDVFGEYDDVEIVATVFDYDDIEIAQREAAAVLAAHPDLAGFAVCDAAGPVGVGLALQEAGRVGQVQYVGIDDLPQLLDLMRAGVLDLSVATKPNNIGAWITTSLLTMNMGVDPVIWFDTKFGLVTPELAEDPNFTGF